MTLLQRRAFIKIASVFGGVAAVPTTQLGTKAFQHPHHRPSGADNIAAPWPGLLSGGPNAHPADRVGDLLPNRPPMQMYKDDEAAYSMNEICINWNAPLVFLLAAMNS